MFAVVLLFVLFFWGVVTCLTPGATFSACNQLSDQEISPGVKHDSNTKGTRPPRKDTRRFLGILTGELKTCGVESPYASPLKLVLPSTTKTRSNENNRRGCEKYLFCDDKVGHPCDYVITSIGLSFV